MTAAPKSKTFRSTTPVVEKLNNIIDQSGKSETEFFEELVARLATEEIETDQNITENIRRQFQSDVEKIKSAFNLIEMVFANQSETVITERNSWETLLAKKESDFQTQIDEANEHNKALEAHVEALKAELDDLQEKHEQQLKETDNALKRASEQQDLIASYKNQIKTLEAENQQIVDLKEKAQRLEATEKQVTQLQEDLEKQAESLQFRFEKEKHELQVAFDTEKQKIREEVRKETEDNVRAFYEKEIERIRSEKKMFR